MLVHRCRFVEYQPSSIQCLALDKTGSKLAVARENGAVEIWSVNGAFYLDRTLWTGAAIRRVCFLSSLDDNVSNAIVTVGLDGMFRVYDLNSLQVINQWQLGAGAIWDLVVLDEDKAPESTSALKHSVAVACSCDDGTIRIIFVPKVSGAHPVNSILPPLLILRTPSQRLVSISAGKSTDNLTRWIWTGSSEGKMYRFDVKFNDRTELGVSVAPTPGLTVEIARRVIPWAIKVLPDTNNGHTIAVGDSDGAFSTWDGAMGTRIQHLKHHGADIVAMAVDPTGDSIFCASVDAGVSLYQRSAKKGQANSTWIFVRVGRHHTHDIQALAANKTHLFSGGIDTAVFSQAFGESVLRVPGFQLMQFGSRPIGQMFGYNKMLVQLPEALQVWRLGTAAVALEDDSDIEEADNDAAPEEDEMDVDETVYQKQNQRKRSYPNARSAMPPSKRAKKTETADELDIAEPRSLLLEIKPQLSQYNYIVSSAVSRSGSHIAFSDSESTRVLYLTRGISADLIDSDDETAGDSVIGAGDDYLAVRGRKTISGPSVLLKITEAGHLVRATPDHQIEVFELHGNVPSKIGQFDLTELLPSNQKPGPVVTMAVSSDAQWLAVGDAYNNICIFNLDTMKYHSTLPVFDARHTALAFQPGASHLAVSFVGNTFLIYDVEQQALTDWSNKNMKKLPSQLTDLKDDQIYDIGFHPEFPNVILLYTHTSIFVADLSRSLHKKRKASEDENDELDSIFEKKNYRLIQRYNPVLFAGFVEGGALAVIERPYRGILLNLPPPFYRHRFAT